MEISSKVALYSSAFCCFIRYRPHVFIIEKSSSTTAFTFFTNGYLAFTVAVLFNGRDCKTHLDLGTLMVTSQEAVVRLWL